MNKNNPAAPASSTGRSVADILKKWKDAQKERMSNPPRGNYETGRDAQLAECLADLEAIAEPGRSVEGQLDTLKDLLNALRENLEGTIAGMKLSNLHGWAQTIQCRLDELNEIRAELAAPPSVEAQPLSDENVQLLIDEIDIPF